MIPPRTTRPRYCTTVAEEQELLERAARRIQAGARARRWRQALRSLHAAHVVRVADERAELEAKQPGTSEEMAKEARKAEIKARLKAEKIAKLQVSVDGASGAQESKYPATPEGKAAAAKEAKKAELKARLGRGLEGEDAATLAAVDQLGAFLQATGNLAGPSSSKIRVPLLASRTLNATAQSRVTLSLRQ